MPRTSRPRPLNPARRRAPSLALGLALLALLALLAPAAAQTAATTAAATAETALEPVPIPVLDAMDGAVAELLRGARQRFDQALAEPGGDDAERAALYGELGRQYLVYDLMVPARVCFANAVALAPREYRWRHYLATVLHDASAIDAAVAQYEAALELRPDALPTLLRLAGLLLSADRPAAARQRYEAALRLDPEAAAAHFGLGQLAAGGGDFAAAAAHFEAALAAQPDASAVRYPLGLTYRELGRLDEARAELARHGTVPVRFADPLRDSLARLTTGAGIHLMDANALLRQERYEEAIAAYRRAVAADPDNDRARQALGMALARHGTPQDAYEQLAAALEFEPHNPLVNYNLGRLAEQLGRLPEAERHYRDAVRQAPDFVEAHYNLGSLYARAAFWQPAAAAYARVVELDPEHREARLRLGRISTRLSRFDIAAEHLDALLATDREDAAAQHARIDLLLVTERYGEAKSALDAALTLLPGDAGLTARLARLLAACPDDELRDGERALALADGLMRAEQNFEHGETVAMALAELGRFGDAVALQRQLVAQARQGQRRGLLPGLEARLALYEAGTPCRAPWRELLASATP